MGRARKQKHSTGPPFFSGRGVKVDEFDQSIPRQAKTSAKRHKAEADKEKGK